MKLKTKALREHYYRSRTNGNILVAKAPFNSREEILLAGFFPGKWTVYKCDLCNKFHVATLKKAYTRD